MAEIQSEIAAVGRPPKPDHLKQKNRVVIMLNDADLAALDDYVTAQGYADRSDFIRPLIMDKIKDAD